MTANPIPSALCVVNLRHAYGERVALDGVSLEVRKGEIFGLLGPNGSGKTTLFRILSTLLPAPPGAVSILGHDPSNDAYAVRRQIGVVFQAPSLDKQLTARENLMHQGHLYGLVGEELKQRISDALAAFSLDDRAHERVHTFSGGMRRRVEVAKGLLHRPGLLLLDEPSTGLDPSARIDLWAQLRRIAAGGTAILLTTHLMEEADQCDRLAIMKEGRVLATGTPSELKQQVGGDVISITGPDLQEIGNRLRAALSLASTIVEGTLRLEHPRAHEMVPQIIEAAPA